MHTHANKRIHMYTLSLRQFPKQSALNVSVQCLIYKRCPIREVSGIGLAL